VVLVTGADITADLVRETAAEVLPEQRLNSAALRQVWQDHGRSRG
jgi:hypothetical protein